MDYSNVNINFHKTAEQVNRQIRAFSFREYQLPVYMGNPISRVVVTNNKSQTSPGTLIKSKSGAFQVATIDYDVLLYKDIAL